MDVQIELETAEDITWALCQYRKLERGALDLRFKSQHNQCLDDGDADESPCPGRVGHIHSARSCPRVLRVIGREALSGDSHVLADGTVRLVLRGGKPVLRVDTS